MLKGSFKVGRLLLSLILICFLIFPSFVLSYRKDVPVVWNDITTWSQHKLPGTSDVLLPGAYTSTLDYAGCGWFSAVFALRKAGVADENYTPIDLVRDAERVGAYFGSWLFEFSKINSIFPDANAEGIHEGDLAWDAPNFSGAGKFRGNYGLYREGMSTDQGVSIIKYFYDKGYYVVPCLKVGGAGHYVFIDYEVPVDEDCPYEYNFRIMDSGHEYTYLSDYNVPELNPKRDGRSSLITGWGEIWVFDLSGGDESKLNYNRPTFYDDESARRYGGASGHGRVGSEGITEGEIRSIVNEGDLIGIKKDGDLGEWQMWPNFENPNLTVEERYAAEAIVRSMGKGVDFEQLLRVITAMLGFLLVIYSVVLFAVYVVWGRVDPGFMKRFTLGRGVAKRGEEVKKSDREVEMSFVEFVVASMVIMGLGVLLLSGVFVNIVMKIVMWLGGI